MRRILKAIGWTVAIVAGGVFMLAYYSDAELRASLYWPLVVGFGGLMLVGIVNEAADRGNRRIEDLERRIANLEASRR